MQQVASVVMAGAALFSVAAAAVFGRPENWEWVFYSQSSGANEVHLPIGYWLAAAAWMVVVSRSLRQPLRVVAPRAAITAFTVHVLMLLAALTAILGDAGAFTTPSYQLYARVFCAAALAAGIWWALGISRRMTVAVVAMAAPILPATAVLAAMLFGADPIAAIGGVVAGLLAWSARAWTPAAARLRALLEDERVFLATVFVIAMVLRLLYLRRVMSNPGYLETGADGPVYDELAWSIAQGRGIRASFTERFPLLLLGYVWFVSAIYSVVGHSYFAVGFVQAVIGSITCLMFYSVAKELCGTAIARTATLFATISFPLLFAAAAIGHQAIDVFLSMAIVWLLVKSGPPREWAWWRWGALGALFGVAIAVRETVTFFLAFVLLWIPFLFPRPWSWRALAPAAAVAGAAFLTISPLVIPKVSSVEQRDKLRHHFDILYRGEADPVRLRDEIVPPLSNPGAAFNQLRESPGLVVGTLGRAWASNFGLQFFSQPYGGFDLLFLRKGTAYYYALWFYAYVLAAAGLVLLLRRLRVDAHAAGIVLLIGLIASRTVPHVILESNYRHRVPIEPFLILLASVAVVGLVRSASRPLELAH
jgi:hypothetical protein